MISPRTQHTPYNAKKRLVVFRFAYIRQKIVARFPLLARITQPAKFHDPCNFSARPPLQSLRPLRKNTVSNDHNFTSTIATSVHTQTVFSAGTRTSSMQDSKMRSPVPYVKYDVRRFVRFARIFRNTLDSALFPSISGATCI